MRRTHFRFHTLKQLLETGIESSLYLPALLADEVGHIAIQHDSVYEARDARVFLADLLQNPDQEVRAIAYGYARDLCLAHQAPPELVDATVAFEADLRNAMIVQRFCTT